MVRKFGLWLAILFLFILAAGCSGKVSQQDKNGESPSEFVLKFAQADANRDMKQMRSMISENVLKEKSEVLNMDFKKLDEKIAKYRMSESAKDGIYFYKFDYVTEKGGQHTEYYKAIKENGSWKIGDYPYKEKDYLFDTKGLETKMIEGAVK